MRRGEPCDHRPPDDDARGLPHAVTSSGARRGRTGPADLLAARARRDRADGRRDDLGPGSVAAGAEMSARRPSGAVLGIGGIGSGLTFALNGDHTLGREESRAASLLDARDYCKLHIVLHHVRRLLPADVEVVPIGAVGDDAPGRSLLAQIAAEGMPTDRVALVAGAPTLFAVSFVYPSGDGGNLTTSGSASDQVTPGQARAALDSLETAPLVVAALPEVPLAARAPDQE